MTRGISFAPAIALVVEHRQCSPRAGAHRPALHRSAGTPAKDSPSCPWWASPLEPASCLAASRLACSRSSCGGVTKPWAATETAQQASDRGRVVGFASVGDLHGGDSGADIRNLVENAVLPDGDAPGPLSARTCEQLRAGPRLPLTDPASQRDDPPPGRSAARRFGDRPAMLGVTVPAAQQPQGRRGRGRHRRMDQRRTPRHVRPRGRARTRRSRRPPRPWTHHRLA